MALSLDGSVHGFVHFTSITVNLTTANSNDVIVVDALCAAGTITGVTATGLSFTNHALPFGNYGRWWAIASSPLSSVGISVSCSTTADLTVDAYGISGANTSSPWDSGGPVTGTSDPQSITTHNTNTMVIANFKLASVQNPTAGSGFTLISGADFYCTEYQILSFVQTISCGMTTGSGNANAAIVDAVVAAGVVPASFIGFSEW